MPKRRRLASFPAPAYEKPELSPGLRLPAELAHEIVVYTLSGFFHDLVLQPDSLKGWDAGANLLQVSRIFRHCTIRFLTPLWGGDFPTGRASDYRKTISLLRRWSELINGSRHALHGPISPAFLSDRAIRSPRLPIVHVFKCLLYMRTLQRVGLDMTEEHLAELDVNSIMNNMAVSIKSLPAWSRREAFFCLRPYVECVVLPWSRAYTLAGIVCILEDIFSDFDIFIEFDDENIIMELPMRSIEAAEVLNTVSRAVVSAFELPPSAATPAIVNLTSVPAEETWLRLLSALHVVAGLSAVKARAASKIWQAFEMLFSPQDKTMMMNYDISTGQWLDTPADTNANTLASELEQAEKGS